jgi:hypothetical protein
MAPSHTALALAAPRSTGRYRARPRPSDRPDARCASDPPRRAERTVRMGGGVRAAAPGHSPPIHGGPRRSSVALPPSKRATKERRGPCERPQSPGTRPEESRVAKPGAAMCAANGQCRAVYERTMRTGRRAAPGRPVRVPPLRGERRARCGAGGRGGGYSESPGAPLRLSGVSSDQCWSPDQPTLKRTRDRTARTPR